MILWVFLGVLLSIAFLDIKVNEVGIGSLPVGAVPGKMPYLPTLEAGITGVSTVGGSGLTGLDWLELASLGWSHLGSPSSTALSPIVIWGSGPAQVHWDQLIIPCRRGI